MATLSTTPQVIGKNESGTIHTYLYGWYDNHSGSTCTVHVRLTCINTGATYTGTNKSYQVAVGNYSSGIQSWTYTPLNTNQEYTIAEGSDTYSSNNQISASGLFWSYNYGSADIVTLTDSWFVPNFGSAPSGLAISNIVPGIDTVSATVSVTNWNGGTSATRYRELNVWSGAISSGYRRYQKAYGDTLSSTITTTNSSEVAGGMDIESNTQYVLSYYANNGDYNTGQVSAGNIVTLAPAPTLSVDSTTATTATISYSTSADGGYYDKAIQYSLDGSTWTTGATVTSGSASSGTFTISGLSPLTAYSIQTRVSTTAGTTAGSTLSATTTGAFYCSVNSQSKVVQKLYGSAPALGNLQLKGDTMQQTYTGKNLLKINAGTRTSGGISWTITEELLSGSGTATSTSSLPIATTALPASLPPGSYTFSVQSAINNYKIQFILMESDNTMHYYEIRPNTTSISFTTNYVATSYRLGVAAWSVGDAISLSIDRPMLETGSTATSYEPYVGSIPAPNPNYPQAINVVTGNQTITISDGDSQSQSYTIGLGTIELCQLGSYHDYIYRSNGNWYLHKETGVVTYDGSEPDWVYSSRYNRVQTGSKPIGWGYIDPLCTHFVNGNTETTNGTFTVGGSAVFFKSTSTTSLQNWTTWLSNNHVSVYCSLATATDTQITNAALIAQLDALWNAKTYRDDTVLTVAGDLPMLVSAVYSSAREIKKYYGSVGGLSKRVF